MNSTPLQPSHSPDSMSPPSLMNSTSLSNESSSPPLPGTPPPTRARTRYGDLGNGHVPLHRRGTSDRYENFEDLLREAGYKETRIFTPETDRTKEKPSRSSKGSLRGGVSAMVGFISNLVPAASAGSSRSTSEEPPNPIPSTSHAPRPESSRLSTHSSHTVSTVSSGSSIASDPTPHPSPKRHRVPQTSSLHRPGPQHLPNRFAALDQGSSKYLHPPNLVTGGREVSRNVPASRATAYLRHIASVPAMRPDVSLSKGSKAQGEYRPSRRKAIPDSSTELDRGLPKSWLESVARTILFGNRADQPGNGFRRERDPSPFSAHSLRVPRSRSSRPNFHDSHMASRTLHVGPPHLLARVASSKSRQSEGVVSHTQVYCRSAPASRNGSKARSSARNNTNSASRRNLKRNIPEEFRRGRQPRRGETVVPTLARTRAEGDEWLKHQTSGPTSPHTPWYTLDMSTSPQHGILPDENHSSTSSDDDEGELDLARILVPPRRHNSIRSLRQHLDLTAGKSSKPMGDARRHGIKALVPDMPDSMGEERSGNAEHQRDEETDYFTFVPQSGATRRPVRRKGIPATWGREGGIATG